MGAVVSLSLVTMTLDSSDVFLGNFWGTTQTSNRA